MKGREQTLPPRGETPYEKVVELLALNAYNAWSTALKAAGTRDGNIRFERLANPQMGDLVLETTRGLILLMRGQWDEHGRALGWMHPPKPGSGDDCTLEALDGTITNWSNANFVAVVTPELDAEIRKAEREASDARVAALRKAGF